MIDQILREAASRSVLSIQSDVPQLRGTAALTRHPEAGGPPVAQTNVAGGDRAPADGRLPVAIGRQSDLARDEVDDARQDLVLVGDVVVERHRLDSALPGEPAHAERLDAAFVGEDDGSAQHTLLAQWGTRRRPRVGLPSHQRPRAHLNVQSKSSPGPLTSLRRTFRFTPYAYTVRFEVPGLEVPMFPSDAHDVLLLAHERARQLREEAAADRLRGASVTRRALAASLRRAADRLDPTPLRHRPWTLGGA